MDNVIHLSGSQPAHDQIDASGCLSAGKCVGEQEPAVIVNPAASDASLAAWCAGEVTALRAMADAIGAGPAGDMEQMTRDDFCALINHRLGPLERVMAHLAERINAAQDD